MVKALGYIQDCGDGSRYVTWVREEDKTNWEINVNILQAKYQDWAYFDGDGITLRLELTFGSYEEAEQTGIVFQNVAVQEEED